MQAITLDTIAAHLPSYEPEAIRAELAKLDLTSLRTREAARYSVEPWDASDPSSTVNGCPRDELASLGAPMPDGTYAFVIRDSRLGRVVWFQTFNPETQDRIALTPESSERLSAQFKNQLIDRAALLAAADIIKRELDYARP
jgi:hypothetical protein